MWRFYVYDVLDADECVIYVGKGSQRRKEASRRERGGAAVREVARFQRESDAYAFEVERIAEIAPALNSHPGGNGGHAEPRRSSRYLAEIERLGSKRFAARLWMQCRAACERASLKFPGGLSKVDEIRAVAYG